MINSDVVSRKLQLGQKEVIQQIIQRKLIADELKKTYSEQGQKLRIYIRHKA